MSKGRLGKAAVTGKTAVRDRRRDTRRGSWWKGRRRERENRQTFPISSMHDRIWDRALRAGCREGFFEGKHLVTLFIPADLNYHKLSNVPKLSHD